MQRFQFYFIISLSLFLFQAQTGESYPTLQARQVEQHFSHNIIKRNLKGNCIGSQSSDKIYKQLVYAAKTERSCRIEEHEIVPTFIIKQIDGSAILHKIPLEGCPEKPLWPELCHYTDPKKRAQAALIHAIKLNYCSDFTQTDISKDDLPLAVRARKYGLWVGLDISQREADHQWTPLCSVVLKENDPRQSCAKMVQGEIVDLKVLTNCEIHSSTGTSIIDGQTKQHDDRLQNYDYAIEFAEKDCDLEAADVLEKEKIKYEKKHSSAQHRVSAHMTAEWRSNTRQTPSRECEVVLYGYVRTSL